MRMCKPHPLTLGSVGVAIIYYMYSTYNTSIFSKLSCINLYTMLCFAIKDVITLTCGLILLFCFDTEHVQWLKLVQ